MAWLSRHSASGAEYCVSTLIISNGIMALPQGACRPSPVLCQGLGSELLPLLQQDRLIALLMLDAVREQYSFAEQRMMESNRTLFQPYLGFRSRLERGEILVGLTRNVYGG